MQATFVKDALRCHTEKRAFENVPVAISLHKIKIKIISTAQKVHNLN